MATTSNSPFMGMKVPEFMDFTKIAGQFKVPNFDAGALLESQRKNIEAMTAANRVAMEGAQALSQRQVEILRQVWDESASAMKTLSASGKPEEQMVKQTELAKQAFEQSLANFRELAEIGAKSNTEAVEVITKRVAEGLEELKSEIKKASVTK